MALRDGTLVRRTADTRRPTHWWLAWLVVMVLLVVVGPAGFLVGNALLDDPGPHDLVFPYVAAFTDGALLLGLYLWVRVKEGRPFTGIGLVPRRDAVRLGLGLVAGAGLVGVVVLVGLAAGWYADGVTTHARSGTGALLLALPLLLLALFHALTREAVLRGYLLPVSVRGMPAWVAVLGSSALVAVLHSVNLMAMTNAFLFALLAALLTLQQGSLWLAIGVHAGWIFTQTSVLGMPVGGIADATALASVGPAPGSGADLLSGGAFGPDTGLATTVVLGVAALVAGHALRRSSRTPATDAATPTTSHHPPTTSRRDPTHVDHHL